MAVDGCAAQGESQAAAQAFLACRKSGDDFRERVLAADPDEVIALDRKDGKALPPPTSGRDFANKMQNVA